MMEKTRVPNWYVVNGGMLEEVEQFCYLEDVLDCKAGVERAVRAKVNSCMEKIARNNQFTGEPQHRTED